MAVLVRCTGPDHIVLRTRDPVASCAWYQRTLGLAPVRLDEFRAGKVPFPSARVSPTFVIDFFKAADDGGGGGALPDAGSDARRHTGFDHFCLCVDVGDIEAVRARLAAAGIEAEQQFDGVVVERFGAQGTASSIYIRDPDHYVVELRTYAGHQGGHGGQQQQQQQLQQQQGAADTAPAVTEDTNAVGSGI